MKSRFDLLPRDMLFKLALELSLPDLLNFCSNDRVNELVCSQKDIWLAKLKQDFGMNYQMLKSDPRENYELLYGLTELKRKWNLKQDIYTLYNLKELFLHNNNQIKDIPKEIGNLTNLQLLNLSNNDIKDIPKEIGNLTDLQELDLSNNKIEEIPKEIGNLTNLLELNLNYNQIKEIPKEIGNLTNLLELYLMNNQIKEIPKEIGDLTNLQKLYLNDNQIKEIPKEIGNLTNLQLSLIHI